MLEFRRTLRVSLATLLGLALVGTFGSLPLQGQSENWSGWYKLDGQTLSSAPAVARNGDGRLEVFIRGADGGLYQSSQTSPGSETWSDWSNLGYDFTGNPVVISDQTGRLWVFARRTNGYLDRQWQWNPGGNWSGWNSLGGPIKGDPAVGLNSDGRLQVFVRGTDDVLYCKAQSDPVNEFSWPSVWTRLGGLLRSKPAVAVNAADGRLEVFVRGTDDGLHHQWQISAGGGWSGWHSLGGSIVSDPAVGSNAIGLEVIAKAMDGRLSHIRRNSGGWGSWTSMGGTQISSNPTVGVNADGRLEVFVRGSDFTLHHNAQSVAGGSWSGWSTLGGIPAANCDIAIGVNLDGRLQVFVRAADSVLDSKWQLIPGG